MSTLRVKKGHLISEVNLPSSKSYANRALILAAVNPKSITISGLPSSTDVTFLLDCLKEVGLDIEISGNSACFKNSFPACELQGKKLHVGEGGTTARFLAAFLLRGSKPYELILGERLAERPWDEFLVLVNSLGGKAELTGNRLKIQGPISVPNELSIDCSKTTQFASAFQLAYAGSTHISPLRMSSSQSYWAMTEMLISQLNTSTQYTIPLDWSSASYPMAFSALNHGITFPGLHYDPYQADAKFLKVLEDLGAINNSNPLEVGPIKTRKSLILDVTDSLDLVPTLGYFLSHIEGKHELHGIGNLVFKESDRLDEVIKLLEIFGKKAYTNQDILYIEGSPSVTNKEIDLDLPNDHRIVMVGTLFLRHHQGGTIKPMEAVDKSYPGFFDLLSKV